MRVIAGSRRSIRLCTVEGEQVRPTTDRIKETLFNMIQTEVPQRSFLDLFSGSGAIGLEALSRGATEAVLVERDREALTCIRKNIAATKFENEAVLLANDVFTVLQTLKHKPFGIIFMDPPYNQDLEKRVLMQLSGSSLCNEDTLIIVEASSETDFSYAESLGFAIRRVKSYGSNQHVFLEKREK